MFQRIVSPFMYAVGAVLLAFGAILVFVVHALFGVWFLIGGTLLIVIEGVWRNKKKKS